MSGKLTTHVLDTAHGKPAAGLCLSLWSIDNHDRQFIKQTQTNADGRTDAPLLMGEALQVGTYELVFEVGDYFDRLAISLNRPYFLNHIPIRFGIADANANYHVPLLVSPWSYSTYRGS